MQQQWKGTPPERIDLAEFIRAALNGVIGDESYPKSAKDAGDSIERLLVARTGRPLNYTERVGVYVGAGAEWNRREQAHRDETVARNREWLADFQDAERQRHEVA